MLILRRRAHEQIIVGGNRTLFDAAGNEVTIVVEVVDLDRNTAALGFNLPKGIRIIRSELEPL